MKLNRAPRLLRFGVLLLLFGGVALLLEQQFYQYVDATGRLHESLFLPLGVLAMLLGSGMLLLALLLKVLGRRS